MANKFTTKEIEDDIKKMLWQQPSSPTKGVSGDSSASSQHPPGHREASGVKDGPQIIEGHGQKGKKPNRPKKTNKGKDNEVEKAEKKKNPMPANVKHHEGGADSLQSKEKSAKMPKSKKKGQKSNDDVLHYGPPVPAGAMTKGPDGATKQKQKGKELKGQVTSEASFKSSKQQQQHLASGKQILPKVTKEEASEHSGNARQDVSKEDNQYESEYMFVLKKKSLKFPQAKYFCRLCDYHCFDEDHCERHKKDTRHQRLKKLKATDVLLRELPAPSPAHIEAVTTLVEQVFAEQSLTEAQLDARHLAVEAVEKLIRKSASETSLSLYGSTLSGFALKDSDVNLEVEGADSPLVLKTIYAALKANEAAPGGLVCRVSSDFSAKVPCVYAQTCEDDLRLQITTSNSTSCRTSRLLAVYGRIDPRVSRLAVLFKYWAKVCKIDRQHEGSLPAYVYGLLVIYFLQQCDPPVLPVLHEIGKARKDAASAPGNEDAYFTDLDKLDKHWKPRNTRNVGELWIQLLRFFSIDFDINSYVVCIRQRQPLSRQEKKWASKKLAIEDPFIRKRNVARSMSHVQVFEYILERIRAAYQYFGIPQTPRGPLYSSVEQCRLERRLQRQMRSEDRKSNARTSTPAPLAADTSNQASSAKSESQATPAEAGSQAAPAETGNEASPAEDGSQTTSAEDGSQTTPAEVGNEASHAETRSQAAPAETGNEATPAEDGSQPTPAEDGSQPTFAKAESQAAPAETGDEASSAEDGSQPTPAEAKSQAAPAEAGKEASSAEDGSQPTPAEAESQTARAEAGNEASSAEDGSQPNTAKAESQAAPAETGIEASPAEDGSQAAPAGTGNEATPAEDGSQPTPAEDGSQPTSAKTETQAAPAETGDEASSAEDGSQPTPAEAKSQAAPAEAGNEAFSAEDGSQPTPAEAESQTAPAEAGNEAFSAEDGSQPTHAKAGSQAAPAETGNEASHAEDGSQAAPTETGNEAPPTEGGSQPTSAKAESQAAPAETGDEASSAEHGSQPTPAEAKSQAAPAEAGNEASFAEDGSQPTPAEAESQAAPAEAGSQATPAEDGSQATSAEAGNEASPAEAESQAAPAKAGSQATPVEDGSQATSAETGSQSTPVEAGSQASPAEVVAPDAEISAILDSLCIDNSASVSRTDSTISNSEQATRQSSDKEETSQGGRDQATAATIPEVRTNDSAAPHIDLLESLAASLVQDALTVVLQELTLTMKKPTEDNVRSTNLEDRSNLGDEKESGETTPSASTRRSPSVCSPLSTDSALFDESLAQDLRKEDLLFKFNKESLADEKGPAVMCSLCQKEGHLKQACPEEQLPELTPLPAMTPKFAKELDLVLWNVPKDFEQGARELRQHDLLMDELLRVIQELYPEAKLQLFGSCRNGFGFAKSDLDICLTFDNHPTSETIDCIGRIETIAKHMRKMRSVYQNVVAITTAKVPIVKFRHLRSQLDGDISLYNTLALENTRMLHLYSQIDSRVRVIGYTMKVFCKMCDICDASKGSLSSYAYTLLVLYYLQQRKPPVLPVLQELHNGERPEKIVDGWNAWFSQDYKALPKLWRDYGRNKESVSALWIGLLRFYTEEFNFKDTVISIRQLAPLTKFERLWNSRTIAIEDPFDLSHNLGAGLSRKMNMYIIKTVRNGRKIFGTPIEKLPYRYHTLQDYLFDPDQHTDGHPPMDRNCHVCGRIGHFAQECPVRREAKQAQRDRKDHGKSDHDKGSPSAVSDSRPIQLLAREYMSQALAGQNVPSLLDGLHGAASSPHAGSASPGSSASPGRPQHGPSPSRPQHGPSPSRPQHGASPGRSLHRAVATTGKQGQAVYYNAQYGKADPAASDGHGQGPRRGKGAGNQRNSPGPQGHNQQQQQQQQSPGQRVSGQRGQPHGASPRGQQQPMDGSSSRGRPQGASPRGQQQTMDGNSPRGHPQGASPRGYPIAVGNSPRGLPIGLGSSPTSQHLHSHRPQAGQAAELRMGTSPASISAWWPCALPVYMGTPPKTQPHPIHAATLIASHVPSVAMATRTEGLSSSMAMAADTRPTIAPSASGSTPMFVGPGHSVPLVSHQWSAPKPGSAAHMSLSQAYMSTAGASRSASATNQSVTSAPGPSSKIGTGFTGSGSPARPTVAAPVSGEDHHIGRHSHANDFLNYAPVPSSNSHAGVRMRGYEQPGVRCDPNSYGAGLMTQPPVPTAAAHSTGSGAATAPAAAPNCSQYAPSASHAFVTGYEQTMGTTPSYQGSSAPLPAPLPPPLPARQADIAISAAALQMQQMMAMNPRPSVMNNNGLVWNHAQFAQLADQKYQPYGVSPSSGQALDGDSMEGDTQRHFSSIPSHGAQFSYGPSVSVAETRVATATSGWSSGFQGETQSIGGVGDMVSGNEAFLAGAYQHQSGATREKDFWASPPSISHQFHDRHAPGQNMATNTYHPPPQQAGGQAINVPKTGPPQYGSNHQIRQAPYDLPTAERWGLPQAASSNAHVYPTFNPYPAFSVAEPACQNHGAGSRRPDGEIKKGF